MASCTPGRPFAARALALLLSATAAATMPDPAKAQNLTPAASVALEQVAGDLAAGQYVWRDRGFAEVPVTVLVSIPMQMLFAYRGDTLIGAASVSTGMAGHRTPIGDYTVLQKQLFHRSNIYSNAPMPYMQRLTWSGIALHAGHNPGRPASHGCIRLPRGFAVLLYGVTSLGTPVSIIGGTAPVAPSAPARQRPARVVPLIVADMDVFATDDIAMVTWEVMPPRLGRSVGGGGLGRESGLSVGGDEGLVPTIDLWVPRRG